MSPGYVYVPLEIPMLLKKPLLYICLSILILIVLIALCKSYLQHAISHEAKIVSSNGIEKLVSVKIGGVTQWLLIRGKNRNHPALLYLHGGPGDPLFSYARDLGICNKLEDYFVMVYWEQRGTGKSYSNTIPIRSMNVDQFVNDIIELTGYIKGILKKEKIFLFGHSWGSLIGILAAQKTPENYYAYIGMGQVVNLLQSDIISYTYTIDKARNEKISIAVNELEAIGPPPYDYKKLLIQRKWLNKLGGTHFKKKNFNGYINLSLIKKIISTPEYSIIDNINNSINPFFSVEYLWNASLYKFDLFNSVPIIDIPVYFFVGRHDYATPSSLVEKYFTILKAPKGKKIIWFDSSGHNPPEEEPELFTKHMKDLAL